MERTKKILSDKVKGYMRYLTSLWDKLKILGYAVFTKLVIPMLIVFAYMYITALYFIYIDKHDITKPVFLVIMATLLATTLALYFIFIDP